MPQRDDNGMDHKYMVVECRTCDERFWWRIEYSGQERTIKFIHARCGNMAHCSVAAKNPRDTTGPNTPMMRNAVSTCIIADPRPQHTGPGEINNV